MPATGVYFRHLYGRHNESLHQSLEYEVHPNDLITLLPGTIIQFREKAEKVSLCFAGFSAKCIGHINLLTTIGSAYPKLIEQPIIPLSENISEYLKEYFALLSHASCDESFKMNSNWRTYHSRLF